MNRLAAERLTGIERLITILVARGVQPIFVLEDTEAAVGGAGRPEVADAFLGGPFRAFVTEIEAPCLVAMQTGFTNGDAFAELVASMRLVEIPPLTEATARDALAAIVANRLRQHDVADEAIDQLIAFYDETERNLRFTLAALQTPADYAADMRAEHRHRAYSGCRHRLGSRMTG